MPQAPKHSWEAEETEEGALEIMDDIVSDDPDKVNPMEARMNCADKILPWCAKIMYFVKNSFVFMFSNHPLAMSHSTPSRQHRNLEATEQFVEFALALWHVSAVSSEVLCTINWWAPKAGL